MSVVKQVALERKQSHSRVQLRKVGVILWELRGSRRSQLLRFLAYRYQY